MAELTLLLFLTTTCEPCREYWDLLPAWGEVGAAGVRPVVVTPSPSTEDERAARALVPAGTELLMKSEVWFDYGVGLAGTAVLVRGRTHEQLGEVLGEGRPDDPRALPDLVRQWLERDRARATPR